jgi:uncharacterized protein (DUF1778 family)
MLQISEQNESLLVSMARAAGKSVNEFIETLLEIYQDEADVYEAEQALKEEGDISLNELKAKYEL